MLSEAGAAARVPMPMQMPMPQTAAATSEALLHADVIRQYRTLFPAVTLVLAPPSPSPSPQPSPVMSTAACRSASPFIACTEEFEEVLEEGCVSVKNTAQEGQKQAVFSPAVPDPVTVTVTACPCPPPSPLPDSDSVACAPAPAPASEPEPVSVSAVNVPPAETFPTTTTTDVVCDVDVDAHVDAVALPPWGCKIVSRPFAANSRSRNRTRSATPTKAAAATPAAAAATQLTRPQFVCTSFVHWPHSFATSSVSIAQKKRQGGGITITSCVKIVRDITGATLLSPVTIRGPVYHIEPKVASTSTLEQYKDMVREHAITILFRSYVRVVSGLRVRAREKRLLPEDYPERTFDNLAVRFRVVTPDIPPPPSNGVHTQPFSIKPHADKAVEALKSNVKVLWSLKKVLLTGQNLPTLPGACCVCATVNVSGSGGIGIGTVTPTPGSRSRRRLDDDVGDDVDPDIDSAGGPDDEQDEADGDADADGNEPDTRLHHLKCGQHAACSQCVVMWQKTMEAHWKEAEAAAAAEAKTSRQRVCPCCTTVAVAASHVEADDVYASGAFTSNSCKKRQRSQDTGVRAESCTKRPRPNAHARRAASSKLAAAAPAVVLVDDNDNSDDSDGDEDRDDNDNVDGLSRNTDE